MKTAFRGAFDDKGRMVSARQVDIVGVHNQVPIL
jgi:hypothetical protein